MEATSKMYEDQGWLFVDLSQWAKTRNSSPWLVCYRQDHQSPLPRCRCSHDHRRGEWKCGPPCLWFSGRIPLQFEIYFADKFYVAIKEPYSKFTGDGHYVIRVYRPSDIAVLRGDDTAVVLIMQFVAEGKEVTAPFSGKGQGTKHT